MEQGDGEERRCGVDSIELSMTDDSDDVGRSGISVCVNVVTTNFDE